MPQYRIGEITVDAWQLRAIEPGEVFTRFVPDWVIAAVHSGALVFRRQNESDWLHATIKTTAGDLPVRPDDFICTDKPGRLYAVKPDRFYATYQVADE